MKNSIKWAKERIKSDEISKYLSNGMDFIENARIGDYVTKTCMGDKKRVRAILEKSLAIKTLSLDETACLMNVTDPGLLDEMKQAAITVKKKVYDNRIVTFAPLYLSNLCVNNCAYCGFKTSNENQTRKTLSIPEVIAETKVLAGEIGHKRLIAVYGEHPSSNVDYMVDTIKAIYSVKEKAKIGYGQIRRVNVNAAPMQISELVKLKEAGLGTYQVFQETYHKSTYAKLHPAGTIKGDYRWRLYSMHRAMEAGIDDVGIGVLFGLYDWRYELLGLVAHAHELENKCGIGPHTISFPRMEPALNAPYTKDSPYRVSDEDFKKIMLVIRLSVPYTGMIITARENAAMRRESLGLGITQTDASTKIGVGAYSENISAQDNKRQQFMLGDTRSLDELIREFSTLGYITSFCTAGYRCGRTGECIMDLLRSGAEGKFCKLNAVLTFREWLDDFASPETKSISEPVIQKEIKQVRVKMPKVYDEFIRSYNKIAAGERDLYF